MALAQAKNKPKPPKHYFGCTARFWFFHLCSRENGQTASNHSPAGDAFPVNSSEKVIAAVGNRVTY